MIVPPARRRDGDRDVQKSQGNPGEVWSCKVQEVGGLLTI